MHLLVRETHALDEGEDAVDLGQSPGELVVLSFSDSDLGALAEAWQGLGAGRPSLRLANLARLRHPMSVDLYVENVIARARCVVIRLLGGLDYWRYGAEEAAALCARQGIALAVVPGDGRADAALAALSTVPADVLARLDAMLAQGGPANMRAALLLAAHAGGLAPDPGTQAVEVAAFGEHLLAGVDPTGPMAVLVFYRSYLLAGDMAPILALTDALRTRGLATRALYVGSLKQPEAAAFVVTSLRRWRPAVVLNATGFSAAQDGAGSPLDAAGVPVLQLVLSGSAEPGWQASARGLSPADLAMQVVLPELDGRLLTAAISFKGAQDEIPGLEFARTVHRPHAAGIAIAADRAAGWARLSATSRHDRRVAMVLSNYPAAGGQLAHAVGLDGFASARAILGLLDAAGYRTADRELVAALTVAAPLPTLSLADYASLFATLPDPVQRQVIDAWGAAEDDPAVAGDHFTLRHVRAGHVTVAIEPDRGNRLDRKSGYHDPDLPPRHGYVAFHLWLRHRLDVHALLHLGAHGTLEWLPGKAVALSDACFPQALLGGLPVVYPFIANNPGEAAAAKRRLGAVTIGHLTPPLRQAGLHGQAAELERLIDEYAEAEALDRRRALLLRAGILDLAETLGLLAESRADPACEDAALVRLDAYLCDIKELQIRDGLHVFGAAPAADARGRLLDSLSQACRDTDPALLAERLDASPAAERAALLAALDGRFVPPGPAGAPSRGRADVLPTGRNLATTDPRAMPTRAAVRLAGLAAADLLARHRQDHGDWPRAIVVNLWGSASMRTSGEDLALALVLLGARPIWDDGSNRVTGIEVLPLAVLDRPRVDVTLRISGLFRDAFETQVALFDSAVRAIAARDEAADWNPLAGARDTARVFGPASGAYGAGIADMLGRGTWTAPAELGQAYIDASSTSQGRAAAPDAFARLVAAADAFVQQQDHREMDLLEGSEYAAHEGGFAAAAAALGNHPALYHADTSRPDHPRTATVAEEVALIVRARAANPVWLAGMMRHGYRGGAEIARAVEGLAAFAATLPDRLDRQFDLLFDATLATPEVDAFLARENPAARADMQARFADAQRRGLWRTRRNDLAGSA
jgi:cobaltochelatase CobN